MRSWRLKRGAAVALAESCSLPAHRGQHGQANAMPALLLLVMLPAAAQELSTSVVDAGGSVISGGEVENAGSFGAFGDVSTGGDTTARSGFSGQIYDPVRVSITPGSATLTDNSSTGFTAEIICDDDTRLAPEAMAWSVDNPLLTVSAGGEVTAALLPSGFSATLTATSAGVTGNAALSVFDTTPDDFGLYAGDGLPDAWQVQHFGFNNPAAAPAADPDADGQDNRTEYSAGTDPNDAASFLSIRFGPEPAPAIRQVLFAPFLPGRSYVLEWSASLTDPWTALADAPSAAAGGEGAFTSAAVVRRLFYRVRVTVP